MNDTVGTLRSHSNRELPGDAGREGGSGERNERAGSFASPRLTEAAEGAAVQHCQELKQFQKTAGDTLEREGNARCLSKIGCESKISMDETCD